LATFGIPWRYFKAFWFFRPLMLIQI
jgi:hypothetical protein